MTIQKETTMNIKDLTGDARITLTIKADFFDDGNPDARDGVEHSIRFNIEDPGLSMANGRKAAWGAGEDLGLRLGELAKSMKDYLCDFDESIIDGFCNGIGIFPNEQ